MNAETTNAMSQDLDKHLNISESAVDISEFGAKGDGSTDDTAAIQSALDYLEEHGGTLNLESDQTYSVAEGLLLQDAANFKIDGNGATIKVTDDAPAGEDPADEDSTAEGGSALRIEGSNHFAIADLAIDDSGASADGDAAIEVANGSNFYLSEASSVNFENIGGPAVNLSVLAAADADIANDDADGQVQSEVAADADAEIGSASEDSDAGDDLASNPASTDGAVAADEDDALSQSVGGLLAGETDAETLDFSSLSGEGAVEESGGVDDQQLLDAASGGDLATATDDTAVTPETGQDDVALLGVTPQVDGDFGFATS
ncbi:glycosyl hydrolase family 28-related protein [Rhodospirillaceae bacterium SYSU D60014]|uniref:glycosyl hydrolase family 28-related protein n=1 Tax=Virgifigura deserti TaxID=2268457 RepID=UPI000E66B66F